MLKRVISLILCSALVFSFACFSAFAGESNNYDTCTHEWEQPIDHWYGIPIPGTDITFGVDVERCSKCGLYKHTADLLVLKSTYYSPLPPHLNGLVPSELTTYWLNVWYKTFGENATATKFTPGGGSTSGGGVGRPKGYTDDNGSANINVNGLIAYSVPVAGIETCDWRIDFGVTGNRRFTNNSWHPDVNSIAYEKIASSWDGIRFEVNWMFDAPVTGTYHIYQADFSKDSSHGNISYLESSTSSSTKSYGIEFNRIENRTKNTSNNAYDNDLTLYASKGDSLWFISRNMVSAIWGKCTAGTLIAYVNQLDDSFTKSNNITINNNTWNGNIYTDNSTNLTYIYPQYTTINEKNETVTNISNTPIIYNNETKQYYTYDQTTKNYYYITYNAQPTPSPSPTPDPGTTPTPTPKPGGSISTPETGKPGGDTGDTTGILAVLVEIRDNMIQGFLDIKAAFVAGFAELSANFTLAIENLNVNIQNIFNKKFPDQSTPETALPSPTPSPSPAPLDPILPETQNLIIPKMNSNTFTDEHGTWIASGSSKYSDVFDFFHAFDRSTSDFWETNVSPSHLQIEIPDPENYYIDGYIMRISKFTNRYAKEWTLQGSDDGNTWDDLDKQTGQNLSDLEEHKYPLTLRKAYKYYRVNMSNYASSMCSLSHFNLLGYDAKDVVTPTPSPTDPPSPSPAPDPGTDPTPVPTPGGGTVPTPGGDSNISGGDDEGLFGWLWDLLKDLVKAILKAIFKILSNILGFLIWIVERVGLLLPFLPAPAIAALGAGVVLIFVIRIIRFIRG